MEETKYLTSVTQWMTENDPNTPVTRLEAAAGPSGPVVASALLAGPGKAAALIKAKELRTSPTPEEVFKTDFVDGITTILNMARIKARYNPLDVRDKECAARYKDYLTRVQGAPFFGLQYARSVKVENKSKNWNDLIDAIGDTFGGLAAEDKQAVVKSLTSLAKVAASTEDTKNTEDLFVQSVLRAGEEYEIFLYSSHVEMESHKEKGSTSSQSLFEVTTIKLRLLKTLWPLSAEKVYRAGHVQDVDDWLADNTTRAGTLRYNLCVGA